MFGLLMTGVLGTSIAEESQNLFDGKTTSIVIDEQEREREMKGVMALQMHSGPPMKVQFKDLKLKKL